MSLVIYRPAAPLSEHVEMFWAWDGYQVSHARERILPSGMMEITIDLNEGAFRVCGVDSDTQKILGPMVVGPHSKHFVIDTSRRLSLLSVWFKPGGSKPFFGVTGNTLHNQHVPLEALWGRAANSELYERLLEAKTVQGRFRILEQMLLARLYQARARHRAVTYALRHFQRMPQAQTIRAITEQLALSPTRFIHVFREDIGITPKLFCRLQRFRSVLDQLAGQPQSNMLALALEAGYYDQAHFINDFRAFAGIAPSAYLPQSREHNSNLPDGG